jgi:hypothetical protein
MDQNEEDNLWPCTIQLSHVSVMATGWTAILELNNAMARVRTQNCLFAPSPGGQISLVSSRRPSRLDWFGRGNVYGEVTTFLESTRFTEEVLDFESWSRADGILREQNSYSTKQSVFSPVDSTLLASQGRWPEAFSLNRGPWTSMSAGVQSWSEQTRLEPPILVAENQDNRTPRIAAVKPAETEAIPPSAAELTANLRNGQDIAEAKSPKQDNTPLPMPMPMPMETVPFRSEGIGTGVSRNDPPLFTNEVRSPVTDTSQTTASVNNGFLGLGSRRTTTSGSSGTGSKSPNPDSPTVKMVSDKRSFLAALKENSDNGTNLTISGLSFLDLDQPVKLDSGKWQIGSEPGALRPVLEMTVPKQSPENNQARWVLKEGVSLKFRSVDFIWDSENPNDSRLFELNPGAQLVFEDCTLTLKGNRSDLFFFEITGSEFNGFDEVSSQKTSIRLIDSIVRTAGGLFRGRSDIRADLEMTGTLAITGGPLVSVDSPSRPHTTQTTRFQLNQTTAILGSSLASVSIGRRPVDTPYLSFQSRRSIISTDPRTERSMIEVRGGDPNQINEDAVEWDGDEVGYHQWQTYRTDQNDLSGMSVRRQNREDWQLNHAENDTQPVHGDLGFIRDFWLTNRPVWQASPSDFAIRENAPGEGLGAKLDRLPQVPELKTDFDAFEGFIP